MTRLSWLAAMLVICPAVAMAAQTSGVPADGVLRPPSGVDRHMAVKAPHVPAKSTPVIRPPVATSGNAPTVVPR